MSKDINVNPEDDWNDTQWIEDEIDRESIIDENLITSNMYQALCNYAKDKINIIVDHEVDDNKIVVMIEHPSEKIVETIERFVGTPNRFYQGLTFSIMYYTVEVKK